MFRTTMYSARAAAPSARFSTSSTTRSTFRPARIPNVYATSTSSSIRSFTQKSLPNARHVAKSSKPSMNFKFTSHARPSPSSTRTTILQRLRNLRFFHNTRARRSASGGAAAEESTTLGGRLKKLSREYGWSALGVYLLLSALDFPFCYLLVKTLGTDRIGQWEHAIVSNVSRLIPDSVKQTWHDWRTAMKKAEHDTTGNENINDGAEMAGWGVEEADAKNKSEASLATQLALAYAIHKSFIFIRVPLAAAVTPKIVKMLRNWGWDIGKRTTKEVRAVNRAMRQKPKAR